MRSAVLVTGGAGFIGSHVVEALLATGENVVVLDDFNESYPSSLKHRNLEPSLGHQRLRVINGDIRHAASVTRALTEWPVQRVIHLAARAGVQPSLQNPALYAEVNVTGTAVLLDACARSHVDHLVVASSSSVYGADSHAPFLESAAADHPLSPYAVTKRANELQCAAFHRLTGCSVTCLRFFTAYGPRNRPDMAVFRFARAIEKGDEILLHGRRTQRDFTYVGDIVEGVLAALWRPQGMLVCNLGCGRPTAVSRLITGLEALLGRQARVREAPLPAGDVAITWADCARAEGTLGWRATTDLDEGLASFVGWYLGGGTGASREAAGEAVPLGARHVRAGA